MGKRVEAVKSAMDEAAKQVKHEAKSIGGVTEDQKLYWVLACVLKRHAHFLFTASS